MAKQTGLNKQTNKQKLAFRLRKKAYQTPFDYYITVYRMTSAIKKENMLNVTIFL